jgi:hypothetical protein
MTKKFLGAIIFMVLGILLVGCQPTSEVLEANPVNETESGVGAVELDEAGAAKLTAVPTETIASDRDLTAVSTKDLLTAVPSANENSVPDTFLIFGLEGSSKNTSGVADNEAYEQAVITAVTTNLAQRTDSLVENVSVDSIQRTEVQRADPCGNNADETNAANDGLSIGYELLLTVDESTHHYVAWGGLAYYCSQK